MRPAPLIRAALVVLCILSSSSTRAQPSPVPPPTDAQRFDELARKGDRARAAGRPSDAVVAYAEALKIKNDPVIAGRLGLILLEAGTSPEATHLLLDAVESAHETSPDERLRFFRGYDAARARVCRLDINVSEAHARVTVDGVPRNPRGNTEFFLFVAPGQREVRASLPGYEDALVLVDAKAGGTEPVRLTLRPIFAAESPAAEEEKPVAVAPPPSPATPPPSTPSPLTLLPVKKSAPKPRAPAGLWSVGLGPAGVFGGVPPSFGFVLSTRRRLTDLFSMDADMRVTWSATPIADEPIGVLAVGALLAPCAHARWLYGCLAVHVGLLQWEPIGDRYADEPIRRFTAGPATKLGVSLPLHGPVSFDVAADAAALPRRPRIRIGAYALDESPAVLVGVHAAVMIKF